MRRQHIIATIILIALFIIVLGVSVFIGQQFEDKKNQDLAFSAGWDKAINEFTQNNVIPKSPNGLKTITGTVAEKGLKNLKVKIAPNIFMPIIDPNKKIREIKITDETTFCKYLIIAPEVIAEKIKNNQLADLANTEVSAFSKIKVGADVILYLNEDLREIDIPTAKQICLQ